MNIIKKFWSYVDKRGPNECWNWIGGLDGKGHGAFWMKGRQERAHRVSWAIANKTWPIPKGGHICHKCDNRSCVNPAHLYLGNHQTNMRDKSALTPEDVRIIRTLRKEGLLNREIGIMYGLEAHQISAICLYKRWKEV